MAKSIHFINKRVEGKLVGLEKLEGNRYSTEAWKIPDSEVSQIVGGWVYLHKSKEEASVFGGLIERAELIDADEKRYRIFFDAKIEAKGQAWRGADYDMAWWSGLVDPTEAHEKNASVGPGR